MAVRQEDIGIVGGAYEFKASLAMLWEQQAPNVNMELAACNVSWSNKIIKLAVSNYWDSLCPPSQQFWTAKLNEWMSDLFVIVTPFWFRGIVSSCLCMLNFAYCLIRKTLEPNYTSNKSLMPHVLAQSWVLNSIELRGQRLSGIIIAWIGLDNAWSNTAFSLWVPN